jgi:hypothetical protein
MMQQLAGTHTVLGVVQYDEPGHERDFIAATNKLTPLYAPVLGDGVRTWRLWREDLRAGVIVFGHLPDADGLRTPIVSGRAMDQYGAASEQSITAALAQPAANARDLTGLFVLLDVGDDRIRLLSSSSVVHTLKRVRGASATAWSTRGWTAHVLAGKQPRLREDRIADFVLFRYLFGQEEMLADSVKLEDALVVDVNRDGAREWSYWPLSERIAPGAPSDGKALREGLRSFLEPLRSLPTARLGLTAGIDSTLVASCAAEAGIPLGTYTLGARWDSDALGARAAAKAAGLPHETVRRKHGRPSWARLAELSTWTEGLRIASGLFDARDPWRVRGADRFTGHGAEIGRADYYSERDWTEWLPSLATTVREQVPGPVGEGFLERVRARMQQLDGLGRPADNVLDLITLVDNVGNWLDREIPIPQVANLVPAYLSADVIRLLLDIPYDDRRSDAAFTEAHRLGAHNLYAIAQHASTDNRRRRFSLNQLSGLIVLRHSDELMRSMPKDAVTVRVLGKEFVQRTFDGARAYIWQRKRAWAILSLEAMALRLSEVGG